MGAVADYVGSLDEPARTHLGNFLARAVALVPQAEEGSSYGMAALRYRGRPLIAVVVNAKGYAVYPFSPEVVERVMPSLVGFESTKAGIRFTDSPVLPDAAFDALVLVRRDEIDAALRR